MRYLLVDFDSTDDVDDEEYNGDFDAFSPGHSQYLTFSFDGDELGELGDKGWYSSIFNTYIFFYSIHVLLLVTLKFTIEWKKLCTLFIYTVRSMTCRDVLREAPTFFDC